jgi:hypothetical protein
MNCVRGLPASLVLLAVAACSLTSLDGLSGGAPSGNASGGPQDGSSPGSEGDGGSAVEGDTKRDADRTDPCAAATLYCNFFDDGQLRAREVVLNGTLRLDSSDPVSAPNALLATVDPLAGERGYASLQVPLEVKTTLQAKWSMKILEHTAEYAEGFTFRNETSGCGVFLTLSNLGWGVSAGCPSKGPLGITPFKFGTWVDVSVDIDTAEQTGRVTIGGESKSFAIGPGFGNGTVTFTMGIYYSAPGNARTRLAFDSVAIGP